MQLVDMNSGEVIAQASEPNGQGRYGSDILTRITYTLECQAHMEDMQRATVESFNRLLDRLTVESGISARSCPALIVSGNTTMIHFLLKLNAWTVFASPFAPVSTDPGWFWGSELGMDYPATWYLPCDEPDPSFDPHAFPYPLIAKPSNSAKWHYAEFEGKKKVFEVEGPDELARIYEGACGSCYDAKLVIQDFIPGADAGLHSVTTYSDAEGNLVMSCMGQVVLQDHAPSAIGNPVLICDKRVEHVLEQAARFLKRFGYRGFANFDVKYDPRDGSYRFFEVNTRAGRNTFYVTLAGVDFVRLYVRDFAIGETLERHDATKPFCYSVVPRKVVERTVDDPELRERVLGMYDSGLAQSPLSYQPDTLAHRLWSEVNLRHQVQKFKKYVWDTGGRQAASD